MMGSLPSLKIGMSEKTHPYQPRFNMLHPPASMINQDPPPVIAHAGPAYACSALSANMVSILNNHYCPDTEDDMFTKMATVRIRWSASRLAVACSILENEVA